MKLPDVLKKWAPNTLATSKWLGEQGLSRQLVSKYCQSGWIENISKGAYKKPGETVDWTGVLYTLQNQLGLDIHVGGYTALEVQGFRHHLTAAQPDIYLISSEQIFLPRWVLKGDWQAKIHYRCSTLLDPDVGFINQEFRGNYSIKLSGIERASLEVMDEIVDASSFEDAAQILGSLHGFNVDLLIRLLSTCKSMRVRRLFLFLAKHSGLPFYHELADQKIDIGKGIFQIVSNGVFIKEFGITVPSTFKNNEEGNPF